MNDAPRAAYAGIDILPWTGATTDETLALGAREYSVPQAKAIVQFFAEVTTSLDVDRFVAGFTENSVTARDEHPDIIGQAALRAFMAPRFVHFGRPGTNYHCHKVLRALNGNVFGVIWVIHWQEPDTGRAMRGKGLEYWMMDDGRIARWDAASTTSWPIAA